MENHLQWQYPDLVILGRYSNDLLEGRWPNGQRIGLHIERSGFNRWPGSFCCVLGMGKTLDSHSASLHINGYTGKLLGQPDEILWGTCM